MLRAHTLTAEAVLPQASHPAPSHDHSYLQGSRGWGGKQSVG